jgi:hypothetical protein
LRITAHDDAESVLAQAGVKLGNEAGDGFSEPIGELLDVCRPLEAHIRFNGERDEAATTRGCPVTELGKLADGPARKLGETLGGKVVLPGRQLTHREVRANDRHAGRDRENPLNAPSPYPLLDQMYEARLLGLPHKDWSLSRHSALSIPHALI